MILINLLYSKEQLIKKDIKEYLKRILILIRRNEIQRIKKKTISEYEKTNGNNSSRTIWGHERNSIKLDKFNKKKRKYFKYEKVSHIRRFYRNKESFSKEKKDTLIIFKESENENVLKKKES